MVEMSVASGTCRIRILFIFNIYIFNYYCFQHIKLRKCWTDLSKLLLEAVLARGRVGALLVGTDTPHPRLPCVQGGEWFPPQV